MLRSSDSHDIVLSNQQLLAESAGAVCVIPITAPYFDSATVHWSSTGSPIVSLRVFDKETNTWNDWQSIAESGQRYLHSMGGIFSFRPFQTLPDHLDLEIRIELDTDSMLQSLSLEFAREESNIKSSVVMILVMILAGGAMYLRRSRMIP